MRYWQSGAALTGLIIVVLLLGCELLARVFPRLRNLGVPLAIVAGTVGLLLGEQVLGLFSLDVELLESLAYHGLAIVFIAVGLRAPAQGRSSGTLGMAFAIVLIFATQALAMGAAWEETGLTDGAQVGLIIAVIGYAWAVFGGIPLVIWGRSKGRVSEPASSAEADSARTVLVAESEPGSLDLLTTQVGLVGLCYLLTYGLCTLLYMALGDGVVWGFHFIFAAGVAIGVRALLGRMPGKSPIDDHLMGRVASVTVDVITCAALAAVQLAVFRTHWVMLTIITTLGGIWTLWFSLWIAKRAWKEAPFEHVVLFYGMSTGTLPTGLALLKVIDPNLRSPAATSAVFGSAGAVPGIAVLLMGVLPMTIAGYPDRWPGYGFGMLAVLAGFVAAVFVLWVLLARLLSRRRDG